METLREELVAHGLSDLVTVTHRDVYEDGFLLPGSGGTSPKANAVFLDLPAPWKALRNLTRQRLPAHIYKALAEPLSTDLTDTEETNSGEEDAFVSPLNPQAPVSVCAFIPCIEQVQGTVTALRQLGWVDIDMVEIAHRRIDIRRERVGLAEEGLRGANSGPKDVEEAMGRLLEVEGRFKAWGEQIKRQNEEGVQEKDESDARERKSQRQQRQEKNQQAQKERKIYKEGTIVSRSEAEIKTHTSYLVFAVLPVAWSEDDEAAALARFKSM